MFLRFKNLIIHKLINRFLGIIFIPGASNYSKDSVTSTPMNKQDMILFSLYVPYLFRHMNKNCYLESKTINTDLRFFTPQQHALGERNTNWKVKQHDRYEVWTDES